MQANHGRPGPDARLAGGDGRQLAQIAAAYEAPPWWYDVRGFGILKIAYRSGLWRQLRWFGANVGGRHLEVAVGSGSLLQLVLWWRAAARLPRGQVTGIDCAPPMLAGAARRFRRNPAVRLQLADAAALPFEPASFDSANIANAIHCLPDVDRALGDVARVLRPGGRQAGNVLLFPEGCGWRARAAARVNEWGMRKGILHTPYQQADIRARVEQAGFSLLAEERHGNTWSFVATPRARTATAPAGQPISEGR